MLHGGLFKKGKEHSFQTLTDVLINYSILMIWRLRTDFKLDTDNMPLIQSSVAYSGLIRCLTYKLISF